MAPVGSTEGPKACFGSIQWQYLKTTLVSSSSGGGGSLAPLRALNFSDS